MNRVSIVRNDFPEKDTGIQIYVKLKGLKDKKGGKEANKQKTNKITPKEDREYTKNMGFPALSLRAAHKIHPSILSAIFFITITRLDI
jgi:hypothetical protein